MSEKKTAILISSAFLIRSGMENLFAELRNLVIIDFYDGSEKNLAKKIMSKSPDFLFVDPLLLGNNLDAFIRNVTESKPLQMVEIRFPGTPANISSRFKQFIDITSCKYDLLERLQNITGINRDEKLITRQMN